MKRDFLPFFIYTFFYYFIHVYSSGVRAYNSTNVWCQQKALITLPIRCKFKEKMKSDFIHLSIDFIYVYSPGARTDKPLGTNFWCQQSALITLPICCRFKQNCFEVRFYILFFFMFHHMYIAPGRGRQSTGHKILMTTERPFLLTHMLQVSKSDFIHIFNDFKHVYSPGARTENPLGTNLWCHFDHLLQVSNKSLLILILYTHFFSTCIHPRGRGRQPFVDKILMSTEKPWHLPVCCKFQKLSLKSDFIHNFSCFYTYI